MFAAYSGAEETQDQNFGPDDHERQYGEEEISQIASDLHRDGREVWSGNPRLYTILKDMDQIPWISQFNLFEIFIENEIDDKWLPIRSKLVLDYLLPPLAKPYFLRAQYRVCSQLSDFQLGHKGTHGHFHSKDSSPFIRTRVMGSGRIGEVDEVWNLIDGKFYARKTIRRCLSHFTTAKRHLQSFRREVQALARINHTHCVNLAGSYTDPRHFAIIMSPVADGNLREYLSHAELSYDPATLARLTKWFGCLATAVQYIHSIKIRHRDIKPENILVQGSRVLLVDFELSHDWKDLSQSTTSADCGKTLLYAAPEVLLQMKCNSSSDIFSLGCVFLEMATVLKRKSISQMRDLFKSEAENAIFCNNEVGISRWIDQLEELSEVGKAPFFCISKMLQREKDLRPKAAAVVELIRNSQTGPDRSSLYFGNCCRPRVEVMLLRVGPCLACRTKFMGQAPFHCFCAQRPQVYRSSIHRSPGTVSEVVPIQRMRSSFYPHFMVRHLTRSSMQELTRSFVVDNRWDSLDTGVKVSCLPGQPLHVYIRGFVPRANIISLQRDPASRSLHTHNSLPVGIYEADPVKLAQDFNKYLNHFVEGYLAEHSGFILQVRDLDHSSRVLDILFSWFHKWRGTLPNHEAIFMSTAIKVVVINKILAQSLVLAEMPVTFKNGWPHRSSPENQSPRLLNRQLKVAFFLLQSTLIEQALAGLRYLLKAPGSWTACLFISMCLSFVLEKTVLESREYQKVAKDQYEDETSTDSDVDKFCDGVYGVVFQQIYRQLRSSATAGAGRPRSSKAKMQLLEVLSEVRSQFELEHTTTKQQDTQTRYPSPLVSALLHLVGAT